MKWIIMATCVLLAGCAARVWSRAAYTQADFSRDNYACERDARQSGYYGAGLTGTMNMQGFFNRCMEAQGYTLGSSAASSSISAEPSSNNGLPRSDAECRVRFGVKCPEWIRKAVGL